MNRLLSALVCYFLGPNLVVYSTELTPSALLQKLKGGKETVNVVLNNIFKKWQIKAFPAFLKTVAMTDHSWEILKLKYQLKILSALLGNKETFVISFMGSSVTAGHDSPFNISFPVITGEVMKKPLKEFGIELISRNAGVGNNPCLPYDFCVQTFAGNDADIVHWEQSYNCGGTNVESQTAFEQFIRQSLLLPSQPVIAFSNSATPSWKVEHCKDPAPLPNHTLYESSLVNAIIDDMASSSLINANHSLSLFSHMKGVHKIATNLNHKNNDLLSPWSAMKDLFSYYEKIGGAQLWVHRFYEDYKCYGPYIPDWGCCNVAGWHPSRLGHQLRADHYSYFWLAILEDASSTLADNIINLKTVSDIKDEYKKIKKQLNTVYVREFPKQPLYESSFNDTSRCYTTYKPLATAELSLLNLVLSSTSSSASNNIVSLNTSNVEAAVVDGGGGGGGGGGGSKARAPFKWAIMEQFMKGDIIAKARSQGYLDFKYMLYGNRESVPLSLRVEVQSTGLLHICQPPGSWGKMPKGFASILSNDTVKYYIITLNTEAPAVTTTATTTAAAAAAVTSRDAIYRKYIAPQTGTSVNKHTELMMRPSDVKGTQNMCVMSVDAIEPGSYIVTIVPTTELAIMIGYVIVP